MKRILLLVSVLVVFLSAVTGCGESRGKLSGKVTFNDKPVPAGAVVFMSADKSKTEQAEIKDGSYSSDKVPLGDVLVAVMPTPKPPATQMPPGAKIPEEAKNTPQGKMYLEAASKYVDIPQNLRDPTTSGLTVKVGGGAQTYDIPLKDVK